MGNPPDDRERARRVSAVSEAQTPSERRGADRRRDENRDSNLFYLLYPSYDRRESQVELDWVDAKEPTSE